MVRKKNVNKPSIQRIAKWGYTVIGEKYKKYVARDLKDK